MNTFDPHLYAKTITIVGAGGTGSHLARGAARLLYDMKVARLHVPQLILIDPDTVEAKNVGRQMFLEAEIGQSKAHVLMRRFNCSLGLDSIAIAEPVDAARHFDAHSGGIVIGCVDNHQARTELSRIPNAVWIDCGNHFASGQVVIGNTSDRALMRKHLDGRDGKYPVLPNAALLFPQLLQPEIAPTPEPPRSCADLTATREQDLFINEWVAIVAAQYLYKLLHRQPIHTFLSHVSCDGIGVKSVPICREELEVYLAAV